MNRLSVSIASLAALAIFCATLTYWVITLASPKPLPNHAASVQAPVSVESAAHLFGDDASQDNRIRLSGILALGQGRGAAAIISLDGAPARAIAVGRSIDNGLTLSAVHARSIVVDQGGVHSEIMLPDAVGGAPGPGVNVYMH